MDTVTDCCAPAGDGSRAVCCAPIVDEPLTVERAEQLARWFGVLSRIPPGCGCAASSGSRERFVRHARWWSLWGFPSPRSAITLKVLRRAGLVVSEKRGRCVYYRTVAQRLATLGRILQA